MSGTMKFLRPYKVPIVISLLLMLVELGAELWQPLIMAKIIDEGILKENLQVVLAWGIVLLLVSLFAFLAGVINSFYAAHVGQSFGYDLRESLYKKVQSFSFINFNSFPIATLVTRLTNDVTQLQNVIFFSLRVMLRTPLLLIGGIVMSLLINVEVTLILALTVPVIVYILIFVMKKAGGLFRAVQEKLDGVNNVMRETLSGIRVIRAFLRKDYEINRFQNSSKELMNSTVTAFRWIEISMPLLLLLLNLSVVGILWFGSFSVESGTVQVGEIVAIVNYSTKITIAFSMLGFISMAFSRAKASSGRISEILNTEIDINDSPESGNSKKVSEGKITFKHVYFQYPGTKSYVVKDVSFTVDAEKTVAVLGSTGAGKTSIFQLLPRLNDINKGEIFIDDLHIQQYKLEDLRKSIGWVPQESLLFTGSIKDNIAWGNEDASMDDIVEAAKDAQIHETIMQLPNKYETILGQKGINLSGGQKQRISIARALVRKPKILLLDDSTSALDLQTEANLFQAIRRYSCTILIITQKISTAMDADKILLLENGSLIAEGNHSSLLDKSMLYKEIVQSQFGKEKCKQ